MKNVKITGNVLLIVGLILLAGGAFFPGEASMRTPVLSITGVVVACMGVLYFMIFWRCPHCHKHLPFHGMLGMENCPYCGCELDS